MRSVVSRTRTASGDAPISTHSPPPFPLRQFEAAAEAAERAIERQRQTAIDAGGQMGECLAFAQVGQDQERLLARVQLPPGRPDRSPVAADDPGGEGEGLGRQRQRGTVENHGSPW